MLELTNEGNDNNTEAENFTAKLRRSYSYLVTFLDNWTGKIQDRCVGDDQRKASFYVWCRYTISIRTLHRICDAHYLPDIYVIARSCVEYDASLKGIIADPGLAKNYLEFPDRAKAYYGKVLETLGDTSRLAKLEPDLKSLFGNNWRNEARIKWCNASKLVEQYGGADERRLYALCSHFAHGSAVALEMLKHTLPTQEGLDRAVGTVYGSYVLSTDDFLSFAWGPVATLDSDSCKSNFDKVIAAWV